MFIDPSQPAHADSLPKFMQHPRAGQMSTQATESSPSRLCRQLGDQQIQGMGRRQKRQQMGPPQLWRAQGATTATGELMRAKLLDEIVRHVAGQ
jgi:hypothetical protein